MLLTVQTARRTLFAALSAASIAALPAAPALAWGDKEQGFVAGVATVVILDKIFKAERRTRTVQPTPFYNFVEPTRPAVTNSIYRTPSSQAFQSYSPAERMAIQRQLRAWGYYHGGIDGSFGPGTYSAVSAFAADEGLTGKLSSKSTAYAVYDSLLY
jgi:hypothetical protein